MSINLLDLVKSQLSGSVMSQAAKFLGESEGSTSTALGAVLPAVLGGFANHAATPTGASGLMDMLTKGNHDGSILSSFGNMLGNPEQAQGLVSSGSGILTSIFGDKVGGLVSAVASMAGIKSGAASSLMSMAAPLLMGAIGKQVTGGNMGVSGLTSLLAGQAPFIKAALPASMSSMLGFGDVSSAAKNVTQKVEEAVPSKTNLMPWLIGGALLLGGLFFYNSIQTKAAEAKEAMEATAAKAKAAAEEAAKAAAAKASATAGAIGDLFKVSLPGGLVLDVPKGSLEDTWCAWLSDKTKVVDKTTWFNFDRLLFDTGKSTLQASSQAQLANVAAIMKAYPTTKIKIGGYTDNVGKPESNMKLSADRAAVVMGELTKLGVAAGRMASEGYGDKVPMGDNTTEAGRQMNRRIAVRVTEK